MASGHLLHLRRGLYATVPPGYKPDEVPVDPYLVASRLATDSVVTGHAALQFHGKAYSLWRRFHALSRRRAQPFTFRDLEFVPMQAPLAVRSLPDLGGGIHEKPHAGGLVRVTTLERTLVDVLDAPHRCGGWEEVWRSLEMIEFFDLDAVIDHVKKSGSALTAARVGWFLEEHRGPLMVEDRHLEALRALAPDYPCSLDSRREPGKFVSRWNLVVPERVLNRAWEEVP